MNRLTLPNYSTANRDRTILLVDDDSIDVKTVQRAFNDLKVRNPLSIARNGEQAINLLNASDTLPSLILLDLNMPGMNGVEFLEEKNSNPMLSCIPTVVLTTSRGDFDRRDCFKLGVSGFMIKPVEYDAFVNLLDVIYSYWMTSELPY